MGRGGVVQQLGCQCLQVRQPDARLLPHQQVGAHREARFQQAEEEVGALHHVAIEQGGLAAARRLVHQPRFRQFRPKAKGRQQIGAEINGQDLHHREGGGDAEGHHRQERRGLREVRHQDVGDELADVAHHAAAEAHGLDDGGEVVVEQHDVGRFTGHVCSVFAHGQSHIRRPQRRGVVDAIAGHGHHLAQIAVGLHQAQLLLRCHAGEHQAGAVLEQAAQMHIADLGEGRALDHPHRIGAAVLRLAVPVGVSARRRIQQADLVGDRLGREAVVAGHHRHLDAGLAALADGLAHLRPWRVVEADQADQGELALQDLRRQGLQIVAAAAQRHPDHTEAAAGEGIIGAHRLLAHRRRERFRSRGRELVAAELQHLKRGALGDRQARAGR